MKYLFSPITPVTDRVQVSHRAGWALYWCQELGAELITTSKMKEFAERVRKTDQVYVYHGMEFKDALNFPGGPPPEATVRAQAFHDIGMRVGKNLISIDREMPPYGKLLEERGVFDGLGVGTAYSSKKQWPTDDPQELIVGDSHALSLYQEKARIFRNDSLTLHGALKIGLNKLVWESYSRSVKRITFYFGNIDIRHHLLRQPNPSMALQELVREYLLQVKAVKKEYDVEVTIASPLPIETEFRKLPKTGWYKGEPFFGSRKDRSEIRNAFTDYLVRNMRGNYAVWKWPEEFAPGGMLTEDVMEKPGSVHLRPDCYRFRIQGNEWRS